MASRRSRISLLIVSNESPAISPRSRFFPAPARQHAPRGPWTCPRRGPMLHDSYVRDRSSLQIDLSQRELKPDGIAAQLLIKAVEISQVRLGVLDPSVGLHSRRDRLQVLPEPRQRRRLLDQVVHQQPALGIAQQLPIGIAGAEPI